MWLLAPSPSGALARVASLRLVTPEAGGSVWRANPRNLCHVLDIPAVQSITLQSDNHTTVLCCAVTVCNWSVLGEWGRGHLGRCLY